MCSNIGNLHIVIFPKLLSVKLLIVFFSFVFPQVLIIILQFIILKNEKDGGGLFLGSYMYNRQLERIELYKVPPMTFACYSLDTGGLL